ncbi:hypothetical protein [Paenibacillus sp. NPDC057934]|uniref:hypothetical protein n=1 Tax=Paenibacillus sp. NPDC057934 TaxID=3346282 RepID=UPI0036DDB518
MYPITVSSEALLPGISKYTIRLPVNESVHDRTTKLYPCWSSVDRNRCYPSVFRFTTGQKIWNVTWNPFIHRLDTDLIEVHVSDNTSTDTTPEVLKHYASHYTAFHHNRNDENIG